LWLWLSPFWGILFGISMEALRIAGRNCYSYLGFLCSQANFNKKEVVQK
jgi:small neutral amino acid transporter SnatA (MarC family)